MNFTDLFVVAALVSAIYGVLVVITRDRQFLTKAVNPHRAAWLIAGLSAIWGGIGILRLETQSWSLEVWLGILSRLVTDEALSTRGKAAMVAIVTGALFITLVAWCYFTLPRDPSTFRRPYDRRRAFQYYVCKLKGGLDYALLSWADGKALEEACDRRQVTRMLEHAPRVAPAEGSERRARTVEEQVAFWRETAGKIHHSMNLLDEVVAPAKLGDNRRLLFDMEFGGLYFMYVRLPQARCPDGDCMYLFAATLSQQAVNDRLADAHFALLREALRNIEHSIKVI